MKAIIRAFKKAIELDSLTHKHLITKMPENYLFMKDVEIVPLTYSEILSATMYYPVMFGVQENVVFPFAVIGINGRNLFLNDDGSWKVEVIPNVCKHYPFGVLKKNGEYSIIYDESYIISEGVRIFDDEGRETEFFSKIKLNLIELARDFNDALECSKELLEKGCLKLLNLEVDTKAGKMQFRNMLIANIENITKLQPEKLYSLNAKGYLLILHAQYLSLRNFKLFDIFVNY
ncbi:MAG: SapC family protein [Thermodesulfovibrio sp.]|nr:SapC family protein [Thermodesulfovibrio sp.]